jgi:hypothetical protein
MRLSEISARERKRQKAQAAIRQREAEQTRQQQELLRQQAIEKARQERRRKNVDAQLAIKPDPIKPVEEPKGFLNNPAFAELLAQNQEDQLYGVDFKFETVIDKKTKSKTLYGYWTKHRIQILQDVYRSNQFINLGNFQATDAFILPLFKLFHQLGNQFGQVYILFDKANMQMWPGLAEVLRRLNDAQKLTKNNKVPFGYRINDKTNEVEQIIAWEVV